MLGGTELNGNWIEIFERLNATKGPIIMTLKLICIRSPAND